MEKFEILIAGRWFPVKGTTQGLKDGWLSWTDEESSGLARPGTWRKVEKKRNLRSTTKMEEITIVKC